jgi:hypothetical protein
MKYIILPKQKIEEKKERRVNQKIELKGLMNSSKINRS